MMKRAWSKPISPGVWTLLALFLLVSIVSQVAAVGPARPMWQGGSETEPNDTPGQANTIVVNESMSGMVPLSNPSDVDYFVLTTEIGRDYQVTLNESPVDGDYQFEIALFDSDQNFLDSANTGGGTGILEWTAGTDQYYFRVLALHIEVQDAPYDVNVIRFPLEPTPTSPPSWDACEINDTLTGSWSTDVPPGGPCPVSVGADVSDLNFVPYTGQASPNPDYFLVSVKAGRNYRLQTAVDAGVDTMVYLYLPGETDDARFEDSNDDAPGLGLGSRLEWTPSTDGAYLIKVVNLEPLPHESDETYTLTVTDISPTPTPTYTPVATPTPGTPTATPTPLGIPGAPDVFEPNYDFSRAALIGLDTKYTNLNFVPWSGTQPDNDFFKLWVVAGKLYTCETLELGTATNTNMILYSAPNFQSGFAGNDDVAPFDVADPYRSRITFFSSYNGYLYILLGQVGAAQVLPEEWADLSYSLKCFIEQPGTATPTPTSEFAPPPAQPSATPQSTSPSDAPTALPTATPAQLVVVPMTTPTPPPPPPAATPVPELFVVEVLLYYDQNNNAQSDPQEGISDVLVRAFDALTGELLSIDYTDEVGYLRFTVPGAGPLHVNAPFFGFDQIVTVSNTSIQIRIAPRP